MDTIKLLKHTFRLGVALFEVMDSDDCSIDFGDVSATAEFFFSELQKDGVEDFSTQCLVIGTVMALLQPIFSGIISGCSYLPVLVVIRKELCDPAKVDLSVYPEEWAYIRALELGCSEADAVFIKSAIAKAYRAC